MRDTHIRKTIILIDFEIFTINILKHYRCHHNKILMEVKTWRREII
jgi:hypothetical protein